MCQGSQDTNPGYSSRPGNLLSHLSFDRYTFSACDFFIYCNTAPSSSTILWQVKDVSWGSYCIQVRKNLCVWYKKCLLLAFDVNFLLYIIFCIQESQVSVDCIIPSKHHRVVLGQKGHHVQEITRAHNVNIKFPERINEGETSNCF
jgi:KH domain